MRNLQLLFLLLLPSLLWAQECNFDIYSPGAPSNAYSCIAIDGGGQIWVGTDREGMFTMPKGGGWSQHPALPDSRISQIAPAPSGGVWIAQAGRQIANAAGGGVNYIFPGGSEPQNYFHSYTNNDREGYGLAAAKATSIALDQNGTVWTGSSYSQLVVTGIGGTYLLSPGGVSIMRPGADRFTQITEFIGMAQFDRPYTPDITQTGCINRPYDIAVGKDVVAVSYGAIADCTIEPRVRIVSTANPSAYGSAILNKWPYAFNSGNTPFDFANSMWGNAVHFDKHNNLWLGTRGQGFAVYKYSKNLNEPNKWISLRDSLPEGTVVNQHAIASSQAGFVAIGTDRGLYMYMGGADMADFSNYKHFDITNSNIPSNNITGVVFDDAGTLWVSTDNGVASINLGELEMYNLKIHYTFYDANLLDYDSFDNDTLVRKINQFRGSECFNEASNETDLPAIAADGSKSTMFVWKGANPENVVVRIKEDLNDNPDEYGYFTRIPQDEDVDSVKFQYHHPKFLDGLYTTDNTPVHQVLTVQAYDEVNDLVLFESKVRIVLPPVLLLHGIFSTSAKSAEMKKALVETGNYKDFMVMQGGFKDPQIGFSVELLGYTIEDQIDELQKICAENGTSIGKVDVLGHSTGGLATRWYMQHIYREDINKFISLHVPHSGSHYVDLLTDERTIMGTGVQLGAFIMGPIFMDNFLDYSDNKKWYDKILKYGKKATNNEGLNKNVDQLNNYAGKYMDQKIPIAPSSSFLYYEKEIRTNSDFLKDLNSPQNLAKEVEANVPTHAFAEKFRYGYTGFEKEFVNEAKEYVSKKTEKTTPVVVMKELGKKGASFAGGWPLKVLNFLILSDAKKELQNGFSELLTNMINNVTDTTGVADYFLNNYIFEEDHDGVASLQSQIGGIDETALTMQSHMVAHESYDPITHMKNSYDDYESQQAIINLLRKKNDDTKFTYDGFNPPALRYDFCEGCLILQGSLDNQRRDFSSQNRIANDEGVVITADNSIEGVLTEDSLSFTVSSTRDNLGFTSVMVYGEYSDPLYGFSATLPAQFKMKVPKEALGDLIVVAQSIDTLTYDLHYDTLSIAIGLREGVVVDSFRILPDYEDKVYVHVGDPMQIYAEAYYSDSTVRIIEIDTSFAMFAFNGYFGLADYNVFTGVTVGEDILRVEKNGFSDTIRIVVLPALEEPDTLLVGFEEDEAREEFEELVFEEKGPFTLYPNPATSECYIISNGIMDAVYNVEVYNNIGLLIKSLEGEILTEQTTIDLNELASGLYIVVIRDVVSNEVIQTIRLIKD